MLASGHRHMGGLGVLSIVAWLAVVRSQGERPRTSDSQGRRRAPLPWRNLKAWQISLYFASLNPIFYALLAWTAPIFSGVGLSATHVSVLLGVFTGVFMIASFAVGWMSKSLDRRPWLLSCAVITALELLLMATVPTWSPVCEMALTAIGLGGAFTLAMTLPLDNTASPEQTNAWTAFVLTIGYVIAAIGSACSGCIAQCNGCVLEFNLPSDGHLDRHVQHCSLA